jgi:hopanoid biosynthesis associated protein HpnK
MTKFLIVNADDFGLEEEVNSGIIAAHQTGVVTSASLIPNGAAFEGAVALARENPRLSVGAHLTLTRGPSLAGAPVLKGDEVPTLVGGDGLLPQSPAVLTARIALGLVNLRHIEKELRAQMDRILIAGVRVTHIDSHQHIHMIPPVFRIVAGLASEFDIAWLRLPAIWARRQSGPAAEPFQRLKCMLLSWLARWNSKARAGEGLRSAEYYAGIDFSGRLCEDVLQDIIGSLPDAIVELSCHPGSDDARLSRSHPWGYTWSRELSALCSPRVRQAIEKSGIRLVSYSDLGR